MKFVLASASPRRQELLKTLNIPFTVQPSNADERVPQGLTPAQTVEYLAKIKAENVFNSFLKEKDITVIGSDTIVVLNNEILGKPKNKEDAFNTLSRLSGNTHCVYTGMCLIIKCENSIKTLTCADCTEVTMSRLTKEEIIAYIQSGEPMDKAGSYGIQGKGALFIEKINGNYFTVVGLNVNALYNILKNNSLV